MPLPTQPGTAAALITTQPNAPVNTSDKALPQIIGQLATDLGSQSDDLVAALDAIAAAINAKPSA